MMMLMMNPTPQLSVYGVAGSSGGDDGNDCALVNSLVDGDGGQQVNGELTELEDEKEVGKPEIRARVESRQMPETGKQVDSG